MYLKRESIIFQLFATFKDLLEVGREETVDQWDNVYIPGPEEKVPIFVQQPSAQHDFLDTPTIRKLFGWIEKMSKEK